MKYTYNGPLSGVSIPKHGDVMLVPGATVDLPEEHPYTNTLIAKGFLTPSAGDQAPLPPVRGKRTEGE